MPRFSECWRCGNTVGVGIICQLCNVAKYCSERCQRNDIFRHEAECIPASILKTCTACRKSGPNLKACTGCYRAFYCDANCQRSNWERHKIDCEDVKATIQALAQRILTYFPRFSSYYYWGDVPAFDCLNLLENEGGDYNATLKVLYLGVGDIRNVVLTCALLPDSYENKILFTLNDKESCVLARLVLLLYMLIKGNFGVEKTVTELWYSLQLSEPTYKYLRTSLEELISFRTSENLKFATAGLICIDQKDLKNLRIVWGNWLGLRVQGTDWIQKQRLEGFNNNLIRMRNDMFIKRVEQQHGSSAMKWVADGVFLRTQSHVFAENPTLTGYGLNNRDGPHSYCVPPSVFPFCGWDYLQAMKFKNNSCLVCLYGEYIESILRMFMKKLSKQQVTFQIVLCDCMDIRQHLELDTVYDRILTSNLMDCIFLLDLLKLCSELLNKANTLATIVTQTMAWERIYWPEKGLRPNHIQQASKWMKIALEDTKRSSCNVNDHGVSNLEYVNDFCEFTDYLRALEYAYKYLLRQELENVSNTSEPSKIPTTKEVGKAFQLRLREGIRNENRIAYFKPAVNRRRATMINPTLRNLEWVQMHKK